ncbi:MAG: type II toxin-antitoxin system VapC family toxin [Dehalococcoidia bacterium]
MPEAAQVDTNILLRYFLKDSAEKAAAVHALVSGLSEPAAPRLVVSAATVSEVVFVARGATYRRTRSDLVELLGLLLAGPFSLPDRQVVSRARDLYRDVHDDWNDCLLAAYALEQGDGSVVSFDRGLDRIPGLTRVEPTVPAANG